MAWEKKVVAGEIAKSAARIRFYLHKEFRAAEIGLFLHKESRAAESGFYLHKEFLKRSRDKSMLYVQNIFRAARAKVGRSNVWTSVMYFKNFPRCARNCKNAYNFYHIKNKDICKKFPAARAKWLRNPISKRHIYSKNFPLRGQNG